MADEYRLPPASAQATVPPISSLSSTTGAAAASAASRAPSPHTIRIDCAGRSIQWRLEDENVSFTRLRSYIQSAFFIDNSRPIVLRATPLHYGSIGMPLYLSDDNTLRRALASDDIVIEVLLAPEASSTQQQPHQQFPQLHHQQSSAPWQQPSSMIPSANPNYAAAAASGSTMPHLSSRPSLPPVSLIHQGIPDYPTSPLSAAPISQSNDRMRPRKSSIYIPPPAKTTPSSRVSGVTQSIRQKLNFVDEGKWKKFSARRLELIDKMALSTKKASEQDDVIIAVADTLREENGFPPDTLQDFDKLVRAAVQSVRRNRKRLPKSKSRSKSLSVERDMSSESSSHMGMIDQSSAIPIYESRMATDPWPVSSSASLSPTTDILAASTSSSVSDASSSYMSSYHPSHLGRLSDPSVGSVRPSLARSPTASSMSSVSTFSSYLSASNEDTESTGSQTSLDVYTASSSSSSVSSQSSTLSSLPRTLPSPGLTTSLISKSVSTALPELANDRDQSIALELLYANVLYPCLISRSQIAASSSNCLPFLLNIVRRALGLADNSLVALYYTRKADGVRYQIASDAEAELLLRTPLGMDPLRIEVLAMALSQSSVVNHQTSTSVSLLSPSGSTLSPVSDTNEPRTRRISIGALVVA